MTPHDPSNDHDDLAARLRALPRERLPSAQVWQAIAAGIEAERRTAAPPARRRPRWRLPVSGLAAVVALLAVTSMWWPRHSGEAPSPTPLQRQATLLDQEYRQTLAQLPAAEADSLQPALAELDASADAIHVAIRQAPDAGFLLDQLRRTYALRLDLTRKAVLDTAFHP